MARQLYPQKTSAPMQIGSPFNLVSHTGENITQQAFQGTPSAVFLAFTHCPEVCPTTLNDLTLLRDQLQAAGGDFNIFFITVDPERDTVAVLKDYIPISDRALRALQGFHRRCMNWRALGEFSGKRTMLPTRDIILIIPRRCFC